MIGLVAECPYKNRQDKSSPDLESVSAMTEYCSYNTMGLGPRLTDSHWRQECTVLSPGLEDEEVYLFTSAGDGFNDRTA